MKTYTLVSIGLLLIWAHEGVSIKCYQCDSNNDPDCTEYFDHSNTELLTVRSEECTVDAAKYCIKTTGVYGGVVGTTRFCSSRDLGNQCQYIRYPDHDRVYRGCIYTCSNNNCNGAWQTVSVGAATLVVTALSMLYQWIRI